MAHLKKILLGYDFSDLCREALKRAVWIAQQWGADLEVLHVLQDVPYDGATGNVGVVELMGRLEKEAAGELERVVKEEALGKILVETNVRVGTPYRDILLESREIGADLIIVGRESRSGLKGLFLGKTAEDVMRKALMPVWLDRQDSGSGINKILLATDLSDNSRQGVLSGLEWAKKLGAGVLLVHVVPIPFIPHFSLVEPGDYSKTMIDLAKEDFDNFIEKLPWEGVSYETVLGIGVPVVEINKLVQEKNIDLIALSTHGRTGLSSRLMGVVATKVSREAPCSVLTFRPKGLDLKWLKEDLYQSVK